MTQNIAKIGGRELGGGGELGRGCTMLNLTGAIMEYLRICSAGFVSAAKMIRSGSMPYN